MYKGIGESSYNDGLFSQAAPFQNFQGSVSQFAEGSLGVVSAPAAARALRMRQRFLRPRRGVAGPGSPFQDGTLGRTFLPAFSPQTMRGLGYTYNDGVLGADPSATIQIGPTATPAWKPDLASAGIGVIAGALLFYVLKI